MLKRLFLTISVGVLALCFAPASVFAGAVGGPKSLLTTVDAFGTDRIQAIYFEAGEVAVVRVVGDGTSDLDMYVYDENGNLITKDDDASDDCVATFVPRWTGRFYVVVRNRGGIWNRYVLRTN